MENLTEDFPHFGTAAEGAPVTVLKLLDTGNAVLMNVASGSPLWQSFENPTDTFLPGMKTLQEKCQFVTKISNAKKRVTNSDIFATHF
ncbi:putative non-specific serine/threonine protein kinase [Helianthus anomalus]